MSKTVKKHDNKQTPSKKYIDEIHKTPNKPYKRERKVDIKKLNID